MHDATTLRFMSTPIEVPVRFVAANDYRDGDSKLAGVYSKAKSMQWNAETDIDWSHQLQHSNPLQMPDGTIAIAGTAEWKSMSEEMKGEVRRHLQGWQISQILHGEQASLIGLSKLLASHPDMSAKLCAAGQIVDEARHVEVYSKLLFDKIGVVYPVSSSIGTLMGQAIGDTRHDLVSLGIQILIEGTALSLFRNIQAYTGDPFIKHLQSLVLRDEARHFAMGKLCLEREYAEMSEYELDQREEFVIECLHLLREHVVANDVWAMLDLISGKRCAEAANASAIVANLRRTLMRQLVPALCSIGLLGKRMSRYLESVDAIEYAQYSESST